MRSAAALTMSSSSSVKSVFAGIFMFMMPMGSPRSFSGTASDLSLALLSSGVRTFFPLLKAAVISSLESGELNSVGVVPSNLKPT